MDKTPNGSLTFALQMATIYLPAFHPIFKTEALDAGELAVCPVMSGIVLLAVEIEMWLAQRGWIYRTS